MSVVENSVDKYRISIARGRLIKDFLWRKIEVGTLYYSQKDRLTTPPIRHFSVTPYITICPSTETYFGLYLRGVMSAVTGTYLFRLLLNIIFFVLRYFFTLTTVHIMMKCRMMASHQFTSVKACTKKYISRLKCSRISFFKLFLVPYMYAFTGCNWRVGKFDVSASNMIIFWRQYFTKLRLMDSGNA